MGHFTSLEEVKSEIVERGYDTVVDHYLGRIDERDDEINAFTEVFYENGSEAVPEEGSLRGVPIAAKDLFDYIEDEVNTHGSTLFEEFRPQETAPHIERLEGEGALIVGKTNTPEFGHKGTTDNILFGATSAPYNTNNNAGGSSGGSAAAVADGMVPAAIGSDAGGSVRIPAALTGTYGLKPSFGRIPQVPSPNPLPFICFGPITNNSEDAAELLEVMSGPENGDRYSLPEFNGNYTDLNINAEDFKVAYSPELDDFPVHSDVEEVVESAVDVLSEEVDIEEIEIGFDETHQEITDYWLDMVSVGYAKLADDFPQLADAELEPGENVSSELYDMIKKGREMSAMDYEKAQQGATGVGDQIRSVFDEYDILLTPTTAAPYVENQEKNTVGPSEIEGEEVDEVIGWTMTHPFNYTPNPVASVPAGEKDSVPIGMQVAGEHNRDDKVLAMSKLIEETLDN